MVTIRMAISTHIVPDETRQKWQRFYDALDTDRKPDQQWVEALATMKDRQLVKLLVKAVKTQNAGHVFCLLEEAANRCIGLHDFEYSFNHTGKKSFADHLSNNEFLLYDLINDYDTLPFYKETSMARHAWQAKDSKLMNILIERGMTIDCFSDDDLVELVASDEAEMLAVLIKGQQLDEAKLKRIKAISVKLDQVKITAIAQNALEHLETVSKEMSPTMIPDNKDQWHVISPECISRTLRMPDNITRQQIFDFAAARMQTLTYTIQNGAPTNIAEREETMDWKGNGTLLQMAFNALQDQGGTPIKSGGLAPIEKKRPRANPAATQNP